MPVLLTKIEGKGNGIKTVIPNMSDVARALSRPPTYTTKFFGCELGAQTSFDEKNDRYIVNGAHDAARLRELLDGFIDKFVLCKSCKNPETELVLVKHRTEDIVRDCKACGERTGVDMRHKLCTFILKNPPAKKAKAAKKGKQGSADSNESGHGNGHEENQAQQQEHDDGAESDDELTKKIKAEAAKLTEDAALAKEAWSDTSPEAVKRRMNELEAGIAATTLLGDDEGGSDDDANSPYAQLGRWVEENKGGGTSVVAIYKKAQDLGIEKKHRTVLVLVQTLFTENAVAEIPNYAPLLARASIEDRISFMPSLTDAISPFRWSRRRSIKKRSSVGLSASSESSIPILLLRCRRFSWRCTRQTSWMRPS
jgi:translation initiation factor 5